MIAAIVATVMARKSPRRSMRIPAGTVAIKDTAPMMPTMAAANACVEPSESAPSTRIGMIAPRPTAKRANGTSTGHMMGLSTWQA